MRRTTWIATAALGALVAGSQGCQVPTEALRATSAGLGTDVVGVVDATTKIRPSYAGPLASAANLDAARNEFEPFQIAIKGGGGGMSGVRATATALTGPGGAQIPVADVRLYRIDLYDIQWASNVEGAPGLWPDPLIPDVDVYAGEKRNAFPFDVAANTTRAIWVDVFVPEAAPPGQYAGAVTVTAGGMDTTIPVNLRVRAFALPSTATLKSAFGLDVDELCRSFNGTSFCGMTGAEGPDAAPHLKRMLRALLDHRLSTYRSYYQMPKNDDWTTFDGLQGPALDGTGTTTLAGARLTTIENGAEDPTFMGQEKKHLDAKGWSSRLFDYTCDEPPATCAWSDIVSRAKTVHAAGLRTQVTTSLAKAKANLGPSWTDSIDIVTPVVDEMDGPGGSTRAQYDSFLAVGPQKELWWYQSCDQHGCGGCDAGMANDPQHGFPSYVIDASAIQNRAMEWLSYEYKVSGELYYEVAQNLSKAWSPNAFCAFGGNGDGSFFYPGTPSRIGGSTPIPIESMRLKMIREGMEDYEYLHLLDSLGDGGTAMATAQKLFPNAYTVTGTGSTPAALYAARRFLADQIEAKMGVVPSDGGAPPPPPTPPPTRARLLVAHTAAPPDLAGDLHEFAASPALTVKAGNASASFRLLWDATALYVSAVVSDPDLRFDGVGRDGPLWRDDAIELMLDPRRSHMTPDPNGRHVIATAHNDVFDSTGAGDTGDPSFNFIGLAPAVSAQGTFNDAAPDTGYRIAFSVPWSQIPLDPGAVVAAGLVLGADLALDDLDSSGLTYADWANVVPFAQPNAWNELQLVDTAAACPPAP